jgi:hypothetical protein
MVFPSGGGELVNPYSSRAPLQEPNNRSFQIDSIASILLLFGFSVAGTYLLLGMMPSASNPFVGIYYIGSVPYAFTGLKYRRSIQLKHAIISLIIAIYHSLLSHINHLEISNWYCAVLGIVHYVFALSVGVMLMEQ